MGVRAGPTPGELGVFIAGMWTCDTWMWLPSAIDSHRSDSMNPRTANFEPQ